MKLRLRTVLLLTCLVVSASLLTHLVFDAVEDSRPNEVGIDRAYEPTLEANHSPRAPSKILGSQRTEVIGATPAKFVEILELDGEREINIGEVLDADDPSLLTSSDGSEVNIGEYLDVDDQSQFAVNEEPQNIGQRLDADNPDFAATDDTVEYQNIGPEITVENYYQSYGSEDNEPQNIGPDMEADAFLAN